MSENPEPIVDPTQADPQTRPAGEPETPDHGSGPEGPQRETDERDGTMGVSSERVGPVAGGRGTIGTIPTYDDPAASPRSTGPNGSVPAPK